MLRGHLRFWRLAVSFALTVLTVLFWFALWYLWIVGVLKIDPALAGLYPVSLIGEPGGRLGFGPYPFWSGDYLGLEFAFAVVLLATLLFTTSAQLVFAELLASARLRYAAAVVVMQLAASGVFLFKVTRRAMGLGDWSPLLDFRFWLVGTGFQCLLCLAQVALFRDKTRANGLGNSKSATAQLLVILGSVMMLFFLSWQLSTQVPGEAPLNEPPSSSDKGWRALAGQDVPLGPALLVMPWVAYVLSLFLANVAFLVLCLKSKPAYWFTVGSTPVILSQASFFCSGHWSWVTLDHWGRVISLLSMEGRGEFLFAMLVIVVVVGGIALRGQVFMNDGKRTAELADADGAGRQGGTPRVRKWFFVVLLLVGLLAGPGLIWLFLSREAILIHRLDAGGLAVVGLPQATAQALALRLGPDCRYCGWSGLVAAEPSVDSSLRLRFLCGTEVRELVWAKVDDGFTLLAQSRRGVPVEGIGGCVAVSREVAYRWKEGLRAVWKEASCNLKGSADGPTLSSLKVPMRVLVSPRWGNLVAQFLVFCTCRLPLETVCLRPDGTVLRVGGSGRDHVFWVGEWGDQLSWITVDRFAQPFGPTGEVTSAGSEQWQIWTSVEGTAVLDQGHPAPVNGVSSAFWVLPRVADVAKGGYILLADRGAPYSRQRFLLVGPGGERVMLPFRARDAFFMKAQEAEQLSATIRMWLKTKPWNEAPLPSV